MKKIIVILAVVAVSALIIVCGVEKVVIGGGAEEKVAELEELQKKSYGYGNVYYVQKTRYFVQEVSEPYSGKFIATYGNNSIKEEGTLKDGKRHGEITTYREDGSIDKVEAFENNVLNGKWKAYYENGNLMCTGHYKDGKQNGEWKSYYENGKLMRVENYKDGKPDGKWEHYSENIKPMRVEYYKNGNRDGKWEHYDENWKQMLGSFVDQREGKAYTAVKIGSQTWMAENLNYNAEGSVCYDNKPENCTKYGLLYNWETAKTVCPSGWHLPSLEEWRKMTDYIGGGGTEGKKLKARSDWNNKSDGSSGNGTDEFGFWALPGGIFGSNNNFVNVGERGIWWSASEHDSDKAFLCDIYYNLEYVNCYYGDKSRLYSVRCVKD
jgi:uncharacterized protein (TIGR02145 family)